MELMPGVPQEVAELLLDIYTEEGATIWLTSRNSYFDKQRPIDLLVTEAGVRDVVEVLGMLVSGNVF